MRYIKGTSNIALCYRGIEFTVSGYVDSNFTGDLAKMKSITGYMFTLAGGAVNWVSKLQTVVALFTIEAEYMADTQVCKESIWIQRLQCFVTVRVHCILQGIQYFILGQST